MGHHLEHDRPADYLTRLAASDLGRAYKAAVVEVADCPRGGAVLDVGCGPGTDLGAFAAAVGPDGRVRGVDHSPEAVAEARRSTAGLANVHVEVGGAHALPVADGSVDRVHTDRVLQHVADPVAAVGEMARVLRPGGLVVLAEPDWDTLVVDHPDVAVPDAYRRFVTTEVVRHARVGRQLPRLCTAAGLTVRHVLPMTAVFREVGEADRVLGFRRVTGRAVAAGYLTAGQAERWLAHLEEGTFLASVTLFVSVAAR